MYVRSITNRYNNKNHAGIILFYQSTQLSSTLMRATYVKEAKFLNQFLRSI